MNAVKLRLRQLAVVVLALGAALPAWAQVKVKKEAEQITVEIDGKPFTVFYIGGKDLNRPYLHPLRSASGKIVNRSFPAGQLPGETTDHPHHAGLFYGHGDVNGYNYWAIQNVPTPPSTAKRNHGPHRPERSDVGEERQGVGLGGRRLHLADAGRQAAADGNPDDDLPRASHAPHHRFRLRLRGDRQGRLP